MKKLKAILLVEDDPNDVELICNNILKHGAHVD